MCNCTSSPANICNQCAQGNACGCPPDYTVMPLPVACGCCPSGFVYVPATPNTAAICRDIDGKTEEPIPCPSCEETLSANCVIIPTGNCYGLPAGTTLAQFIDFMCTSPAFIEKILTNIGNSSSLGNGFCQLVQNCPPVGSGTTPIIGTISVSFP